MIKKFIKKYFRYIPIQITKNQYYDYLAWRIIKSHLNKSSNCVDVGCYEGDFVDLYLKMGGDRKGGVHFGFEPIPNKFLFLKEKYKNHPNVHLINKALSDKLGLADFNYVESNPSYSGLIKREYDRPEEKDRLIEVSISTLDSEVPKDISISFIKIDVEGAELLVLRGGKNLIKRHQPIIIFEHGLGASDKYGHFPKDIFQFFTEVDMCIYTLSSYLKNAPPLDLVSFQKMYFDRVEYYFVAHKNKQNN